MCTIELRKLFITPVERLLTATQAREQYLASLEPLYELSEGLQKSFSINLLYYQQEILKNLLSRNLYREYLI